MPHTTFNGDHNVRGYEGGNELDRNEFGDPATGSGRVVPFQVTQPEDDEYKAGNSRL